MELAVKLVDGRTLTVTPTPKDLVQFERRFNMPAANIEKDQRVEYVMWLAWTALSRTQQIGTDFDTFLDDLDSLEEPESHPLPPPA